MKVIVKQTEKQDKDLVIDMDDLASLCMEAMYVIDFQKRVFHSISKHSLFLCGHSHEEALKLGIVDFYKKIVSPKDQALQEKILSLILNRLSVRDEQTLDIKYISFNFMIKSYPQIGKTPEYLMVYHKLNPIFVNGQIQFGICVLTCSVIPKSGNLRIYYKNSLYFDEYSDKSGEWERHQFEPLTEQELLILRFSKQRLNNKQIADKLGITYDTVRHAIRRICEKFHVETMVQAIIYATDHLLLFDPSLPIPKRNKKKKKCKKRDKLTPKILQDIGIRLDRGQSVNSIAKK
jgi:DNA-binding CsgD family transcriptional regulator